MSEICAFEATLPDSKSWLLASKDEAELRLVISTDVAALLCQKLPDLSGKMLVVTIGVE